MQLLRECLESVLAQSFRDLEVVVVDDGSSKDIRGAVSPYPVRYIRQEKSGPAAARNRGIELAAGEYIAFLDSDDFWVPTKIEKMVVLARSRPDAGLLYHRYLNTNIYGDPMAGPEPPVLQPPNSPPAICAAAGSYWHSVMSTLMLMRDLLRKIVPNPAEQKERPTE